MKIADALKQGGKLPEGTYPAEVVTGIKPAAPVTLDAANCLLEGLTLKRCANLRIIGGTFTGNLSVDESTDVTLTSMALVGCTLRILNRSQRITASNFHAVDGWTGVAGPGRVDNTYTSTGIVLEDFLIERQRSDGIQLGDWHDVVIRRGVIRDIRDPVGVVHNDCIQLTGGTTNLLIEHVQGIGASAFLMAQPQIRPITDLTVRECMGVSQWSVSVQCQGIPGAWFVNNVFRGKNGSLWLRKGGQYSEVTSDTVVTGNALSHPVREMDGCTAGVSAGNAIS